MIRFALFLAACRVLFWNAGALDAALALVAGVVHERRDCLPRPETLQRILLNDVQRDTALRKEFPMPERWVMEFSGKGFSVFLGLIVGGLLTWLAGRWRRYTQRQSVIEGDARDTIVIQQHVIERTGSQDGPPKSAMRIRTLGQSEVDRVVPNGHLAAVLLQRAFAVSLTDTLISMEGPEGSFLLETLTNFVCDRTKNAPFDHDLYVMAPCCEPAELAQHQPITILIIALRDLVLFERWQTCRHVHVEHGSDGSRVLTLMELAKRFRKEQEDLTQRRATGARTKHVETIYILDLALDKRCASIPTKPVPWERVRPVLESLRLESRLLAETHAA